MTTGTLLNYDFVRVSETSLNKHEENCKNAKKGARKTKTKSRATYIENRAVVDLVFALNPTP